MNRRIISALLVFLLLASVAVPTATAEPIIVGAAAPAAAKLFVDGITVIVTSAVVIELGKNIGKTWDETAENWDNFCKGVSKELDKLFHAKQWIKVTSPEGKAALRVVYECWNAGGSSGGKKNDKWYLEARRHNYQIEINPERMTEEQAVKKMGEGKDIITVSKNLARKVVERFEGKPRDKIEFEISQKTREGYYEHLHYEAQDMRLHCWVWRP